MLRYISTLSLILILSSCSSGSFVGKRVDNFTAYYNTFYNAERVFDGAEESLEVKDPPVNREVFLEVFATPDRVGNRQDFDNTIKKSADVLREHDNSKWVDDALLLIGKSNFYTQNYSSAENYFLNVIEVSTKLDGEAQAWLGKTRLAAGEYDEAITHLSTTLDSESMSRKWAPTLMLQLGDAYVRTGNYEDAANMLRAGIGETRDKDQRARASFLLGQVYEALGDTLAAIGAYSDAADHEALYELSFAGQFKEIELLASTDPDEANRLLRRMERDDKHFNNKGQLDYLRGRLLMEQEKWTEARDYLNDMLSEPVQTDRIATGQAHYALGQIYEYHLIDYSRAAAHYDTASTNLDARVSEARADAIRAKIQDPFAPGALTDAGEKSEVFGAFAEAFADVSRIDSLLELGSLDDAAFEERIQQLRRQRLIEMEEQRRLTERRAIEAEFRNSGGGVIRQGEAGKGAAGNEELASAAGQSESGFLHHKDPIQMRTGVQNFIEVWGERPLVDNWRIESILVQEDQREASADGNRGAPGARDVSLADMEFLPDIDVSDVPRTEFQQRAAREERAEARYLVGNVLFLNMNRADSAAHWYQLVVEEDAEFEVSQRAHYALLETRRAAGNTADADRLERQLLERYPESEFAKRVRGDSEVETSEMKAAISDSVLAAYRDALNVWIDDNEHQLAYDRMLRFAADHDSTALAPKALYAATTIYHDWARIQGVDPLDAVKFETSDSLLAVLGIERQVISIPTPEMVDSTALGVSDINADRLESAVVSPDSLAVGDSVEVAAARNVDARNVDARNVDAVKAKAEKGDSVDAKIDEVKLDTTGVIEAVKKPVEKDTADAGKAIDEVRKGVVDAGKRNVDEIDNDKSDSLDAAAVDEARAKSDVISDSESVTIDVDSLSVADSLVVPIDVMPDTTMADAAVVDSSVVESLLADPTLVDSTLADSTKQRVYFLTDIFNIISQTYPASEEAAVVADLVVEREEDVSEPAEGDLAAADADRQGRLVNDDVVDSESRKEGSERSAEISRAAPRKGGVQNAPEDAAAEQNVSEIPTEFLSADELSSQPLIIGGPESMKRRIRFPEDTGEHPNGGVVVVEFVISRDGFVQVPTVLEGLSGGYDEMALQVVREIRFRPAVNKRSQPVPFKMQLEIPFER